MLCRVPVGTWSLDILEAAGGVFFLLGLTKKALGSHGYCALGSNRGPFDAFEMTTIESKNKSIVPTNAFFIDRVALNGSCGTVMKIRGSAVTQTAPFAVTVRLLRPEERWFRSDLNGAKLSTKE